MNGAGSLYCTGCLAEVVQEHAWDDDDEKPILSEGVVDPVEELVAPKEESLDDEPNASVGLENLSGGNPALDPGSEGEGPKGKRPRIGVEEDEADDDQPNLRTPDLASLIQAVLVTDPDMAVVNQEELPDEDPVPGAQPPRSRSQKGLMLLFKERVKAYIATRPVASSIPLVAMPVAPVEVKVRAIPGCNAEGVSFLKLGIASTEMLKDKVIRPLMPDADCDVGWVQSGLEQRVGVPRRDRHYKDHNYARSPLCGLVLWSPVKDDIWALTDHDADPLIPGWKFCDRNHKRDLKEAGMKLNTILRHSGPKPWRAGGFWLGADSGAWS